MTTETRCLECSAVFPAHVVEQFGGICPACLAGFAELPGAEAPSILPPGSVLGRYEIQDVLGRGGMGVVYRARQTNLDRIVALKVLSPRLAADREFIARFEHEAKALARLSHPQIVAVYDSGVDAGQPYLAMELVEGETLRALLAKRRLEPEQALRIVPQLCEALEYAHDQGIIHRDIKPENILLDREGRVKIADFGLSMMLEAGTPRLTQTRSVMGTPHYMAPEQVENPKSVDHRADIYSMGVVFYEMLTGELPLGAFRKPSEKAKVHRRFDGIVLRALAKEPPRRYQRAGDLGKAVAGVSRGSSDSRVVQGFEWKSRAQLFGWPLVHVCFGQDDLGQMAWAKGIIAIGNRAIGLVAIGGAAIGLLAFGGLAIGLLLALGGGALGGFALGGGAVGGVAFGGGALGYYASGGAAWGRYVESPLRSDPEAQRFFSWLKPQAVDSYEEGMKAWKEKNVRKAQILLFQVPPSHPRYPEAMKVLGLEVAALEGKDPASGLRILSVARVARPNDATIENAYLQVLDLVTRKELQEAGKAPDVVLRDAKEADSHVLHGESKDFLSYVQADRALQRIEDRIREAKTVKIVVTGQDSVSPELDYAASDYQGTILLKEGNRARLEFDVVTHGKKQHRIYLCDGSTLHYDKAGQEATLKAVPQIRDQVSDFVTRVGFLYHVPIQSEYLGLDAEGNYTKARERFQIGGLIAGPDDGPNRTLTYTLSGGKDQIGEVRLWYDPQTYRPLKRTMKKSASMGGGTLTETFTEYLMDGEVSDDAFRAPGGK